jgi:hypothetical protein
MWLLKTFLKVKFLSSHSSHSCPTINDIPRVYEFKYKNVINVLAVKLEFFTQLGHPNKSQKS